MTHREEFISLNKMISYSSAFTMSNDIYKSQNKNLFNPYDGWRYTASDSALCATEAETEQKFSIMLSVRAAFPRFNFCIGGTLV